ncbi:MAG TPA: calcium/sodium antiporter [Bacteroidales bacterium]|nr:calcium/sodium antiporter [Bacteroidales bacterium]
MILSILLFIVSIGILYLGAEMLVKGASSLALKLGLSALVVGLTVVAFGTSAPELVVSLNAAFTGKGNIAIGNAIGSNIFNTTIILGLAALVKPLLVQRQLLRKDTPIMIGVMIVFAVFFFDYKIGRLEAATLFLLLIGYTTYQIKQSRKESRKVVHDFGSSIEPELPKSKLYLDVILVIAGLGALVGGSELMVHHAVIMAKLLGMSDALIGLTIIAAGTSMPELATSVLASFKGKSDIAIGNIIGSSVFNILAIIGLSGVITPIEAPEIHFRDISIMIGMSVLMFIFLITKRSLSKQEGLVLVAGYVAYILFLLLRMY